MPLLTLSFGDTHIYVQHEERIVSPTDLTLKVYPTLQQVLEPYKEELNENMKKVFNLEGFDFFKDMCVCKSYSDRELSCSFSTLKYNRIMNGFNYILYEKDEHLKLKIIRSIPDVPTTKKGWFY